LQNAKYRLPVDHFALVILHFAFCNTIQRRFRGTNLRIRAPYYHTRAVGRKSFPFGHANNILGNRIQAFLRKVHDAMGTQKIVGG
jgi:hypothetical protein